MSNTQKTAVLVGCGGICQAWLNPISKIDNLKIVGLVDLDIARCEERKEKFELTDAVCSTDLDTILKELKPDIVLDCTIPEAHGQVALTAFANNCHVLTEKPLTATMEEAVAAVKAAEKAGKIYSVIQNRRYMDNIITYRDTIADTDTFGAPTTLNADFYLGIHFGGFRDEMDHVLLLDMSIHSFDQARFICGKDPVSVYCHEWNPSGSWFKHGASAIAVFEMSDGVVFTYRGSWCSNGLSTSWECEWRTVCENGSTTWDGKDGIQAEHLAPGTEEEWSPKMAELPVEINKSVEFSGHAGIIREFLDCIDTGKVPQTHAADNIKSLAMVHAAIKSAEEGRKVMISEVL